VVVIREQDRYGLCLICKGFVVSNSARVGRLAVYQEAVPSLKEEMKIFLTASLGIRGGCGW